MAKIDKNKALKASILDRLVDDDPSSPTGTTVQEHHYLRNLRASVRRDLENLLNTRFRIVEPPEQYGEVVNSQLNYGLPDLATVNIFDTQKKQAFTQQMEKIILTFEPRFKSVSVVHIENKDKTDRTLRFRIDTVLYADPAPESIVFDSVLEPVLRTVSVAESHSV